MYIRRKVFSVGIDAETGEEKMFSTTEIISEEDYLQKEFNSKAAKALNTKYLKQVAAKNGIPVYESKGFKTVERDPKKWKHDSRIKETMNYSNDYFNRGISYKPSGSSASGSRRYENMGDNRDKKLLKKHDLTQYDHDVENNLKNLTNSQRKYIVEKARENRLANKN